MKPRTKRILKRCVYVLLGLMLLFVIGTFGVIQYAKSTFFRDTPNTLTFEGELHPVPFQWSPDNSENYIEPHGAILIPVSLPELPDKFYMQFDTGSPFTYIRPGALESLKSRGIEFELFKEDERTFIKKFELNVAGNRVALDSGRIYGTNTPIDWEDPKTNNVIGSFGADFLDQKICEIDFPAQEIRLYQQRPEALNALGDFTPFKFKGRRIMFPANINGSDVEVLYDSGCSAFGLLTSKYHYDRLTDPNEKEIAYGANRRGESIPIHHKSSDVQIKLGSTDLSLKRISYAEMYNFLQSTVGRFIGGGFLGNKSLTECTLIIDAKTNEFLVVRRSLSQTADRAATEKNGEQAPPQTDTSANANSTISAAETGLIARGSGTSDDTNYMEIRIHPLPSGNPKLNCPMKVYRNRARKSGFVYQPDIKFNHVDWSDETFQPWLLSVIDKRQTPIQIPFILTKHNNISIQSVLSDKHKLALMFHTAADEVSLTKKTLAKLPEIKLDQQADVESWGGESKTRFARGFELSIGPVELDYVTIFQSMRSGHQTDGKFGPRQLKSKFIEIDFDRSEIILHQTLPSRISGWERLAIAIENGMMFVDGNIHIGENVVKQRFMVHSGYSGFSLLDDEFVAKHKYINELEVIDESELTDSGGNKLKTKKSSLPQFSIGAFEFDDVPVSFFGGAMGRQKFSVLGGDFLKRFNLVFDLENKALYLKKSKDFAAAHH